MAITYGSGYARTQDATTWRSALVIRQAHRAQNLALRFGGAGIDYRVMAYGVAGDELLASGASGTDTVTRIAGLPECLACQRVELQVHLTSGSTGIDVQAEASWVPLGNGPDVMQESR